MLESSIDFPQNGLDKNVWDGETLKPSVKQTILSVLSRYPGEDLVKLGKVYIVGSIGSNQYSEDADIDVHVNPDDTSSFTEENAKRLKAWFDNNRDRINGWVGEHPIEVYLQLDPNQDMLSDGVYDVKADRWVKGPKLVDSDFNPYENYADLFDTIRQSVSDADQLFGELKRDVIDYDVIEKALSKLPPEAKKKVEVSLTMKLDEIEQDIEDLYKERGKWVDMRKNASKPASLEQAEQDIELAKNWEDSNAVFKFINRYKYLKVIDTLQNITTDGLKPGEVGRVKNIIGADDARL